MKPSAPKPSAPDSSAPVPAAGPLLEVRGLRKEFAGPEGTLAILCGVDLALDRGASLAVMGPSGSGKSTLLHILGTLDRPTAGAVRVAGQDPFALDEAGQARFRNRWIGFVFQDHQLLPQCTAIENVLVPTLATRAADPAAAAARARALLERVGLGARLVHRPADLSGGECQRVAIARALINAPGLLLCDEPTGNLDEASAEAVAACFLQMQREEHVALVVTTHNAAFAARFDRVERLHEGRLEKG